MRSRRCTGWKGPETKPYNSKYHDECSPEDTPLVKRRQVGTAGTAICTLVSPTFQNCRQVLEHLANVVQEGEEHHDRRQ